MLKVLKQALEKIATVNAMDYEYQQWAREALAKADLEKQEPVATKRWPFVETPGEFTDRLRWAFHEFGALLPAVRYVLIETPPTLTSPPQPRKPLTEEQLILILDKHFECVDAEYIKRAAKEIASHGIKE
jgi:hypothetical protein